MLPAIWIFTLLGVTLWSLLCWGLHVLLAVDPMWVENVEALIREVPFAAWIGHWVPGWHEMLNVAMDLTSIVLSWVGTNTPLVAWIVWGIGALVLFGTGMLLTLAVCLLRELKSSPVSAHRAVDIPPAGRGAGLRGHP